MSAWWHIEDSKGKVLKRDQGTYESTVDGNNISDLVKAQNRVVHDLSRDIASALSRI